MMGEFLLFAVLGTLASRLLGVELSWPRRLFAAFLGVSAGSIIAWLLAGWRPPTNPTTIDVATPVHLAWSLMATLAAVGLFELAARPGQAAGALSRILRIPRFFGDARRRILRSRRYAQVVGVATRNGLGEQFGDRSTRSDETLSAERPRWRRIGRPLRATLDEAGGAFVKFGQFLSTRPDLVPAEIAAELAGLQDDVSVEPRERIDEVLRAELGADADEVFAEFNADPLAAASIGQVHRARLLDGEQVIVKVQRPGVQAIVERDLDIARRLAGLVEERTPWGRDLGVVELANGFSASLMEELDFRVEARNAMTVRRALDGDATIRVPLVHQELSTARVLVLEWMDGVSLRTADSLIAERGLDRTKLARGLLGAVLRQIMVGGVFHADPHPGNVLVRSDGTLALIDFGAVGRIDSLQQSALARLVLAIGQRDPRQLRDALLDIATARSATDEDLLERALSQFLVQRLGPGMKPDAGMFADLFGLLIDFGLSFPPAIGAVFRALITLDGTLNRLDPGFNLIDEATAEAGQWMASVVLPDSVAEAIAGETLSLLPVLRRLPRRIDRIAGAAERGDLSVNVRLFADERDTRVVNRLVNRALLVVIAAAVGLISTLLLDTPGGPDLTQSVRLMEALGYLGLGISAVLFLRAFVALMRTDK